MGRALALGRGIPLPRKDGTVKGTPKVNTTLISAIVLVGLVLIAVFGLLLSLRHPSGEVKDGGNQTISGVITVAPSLAGDVSPGDVLFIMAKREEGPPVAVKRIQGPSFPLAYTLGPEDVMIPGTPFEGRFYIVARLKKDGTAGPPKPGDLEGVYPGNPARVGETQVHIDINQRH